MPNDEIVNENAHNLYDEPVKAQAKIDEVVEVRVAEVQHAAQIEDIELRKFALSEAVKTSDFDDASGVILTADAFLNWLKKVN